MKIMIRTGLAFVLALACCLPAMAAAAPDKAEKVASGMLKFDDVLTEGTTRISGVLATMNSLSTATGSDLVSKYKTFTKQVNELDATAKKAKARSEDATSQREEYLEQWQESQGQIQNEELKAASAARRAELMPKIEGIKEALTAASQGFAPFMQDLKDLTIFLGNDLSTTGIAAASELMAKCTEGGAKVNADIERGSAGVKDLAASISPTSAAKK